MVYQFKFRISFELVTVFTQPNLVLSWWPKANRQIGWMVTDRLNKILWHLTHPKPQGLFVVMFMINLVTSPYKRIVWWNTVHVFWKGFGRRSDWSNSIIRLISKHVFPPNSWVESSKFQCSSQILTWNFTFGVLYRTPEVLPRTISHGRCNLRFLGIIGLAWSQCLVRDAQSWWKWKTTDRETSF